MVAVTKNKMIVFITFLSFALSDHNKSDSVTHPYYLPTNMQDKAEGKYFL